MFTCFMFMVFAAGFGEAYSNFKWIWWETTGYYFTEHPFTTLSNLSYYMGSIFRNTTLMLADSLKISANEATTFVVIALLVNSIILFKVYSFGFAEIKADVTRLIQERSLRKATVTTDTM